MDRAIDILGDEALQIFVEPAQVPSAELGEQLQDEIASEFQPRSRGDRKLGERSTAISGRNFGIQRGRGGLEAEAAKPLPT